MSIRFLFVLLLVSSAFPVHMPGNSSGENSEPSSSSSSSSLAEGLIRQLYNSVEEAPMPSFRAFKHALVGHLRLHHEGLPEEGRKLLTVIDFSMPSSQKRLWIIDLDTRTVSFHTYVSHGRNSGNLYAESFSNRPQSYQSSLGFYLTGETYFGKHGLSLRLEGVEPGINDKAYERAIVMHGADYVSEAFIESTGRLGRSFGCPAVPNEERDAIIHTIKEGTVLFIYYPDHHYLQQSKLLSTPVGPEEARALYGML